MTALPPATDFTGAGVTQGNLQDALTHLHDFLAGLLGTTGVVEDANAALGIKGNLKNVITGGDFSTNPWQRGAGGFAITSAISRTADRWCCTRASGANYTVSKQATGDTNYANMLRLVRSAGDTSTVAAKLAHNMESAESIKLQGKTVTLAVRGKKGATLSGNAALELYYGTGTDENILTGLTGQTLLAGIDIDASFSVGFDQFSVGVAVPNTATQLAVLLTHTPAGTAGATDLVDIEVVQLSESPSFSGFERRNIGLEAALCRRFLPGYTSAAGLAAPGMATGTTTGLVFFSFGDVLPRVIPTGIAISGAGHFNALDGSGGTHATNALAFGNASPYGSELTFGVASGLTAGQASALLFNNAGAQILFTGAEL